MYQLVKLTFPFADNFDKGKARPALVVPPSFGPHNQLIVAYITKNLENRLETALLIDPNERDFSLTGLPSASLIKLHRLITIIPSQIGVGNGIIGTLPSTRIPEVKKKLLKIFQLK